MDSASNCCNRLNIMQWNAQSLRPKLLSLEQILYKEKIHIAGLSETWLTPDTNLRINGYNIYRRDRPDSYGGVAIAVHTSVVISMDTTTIGLIKPTHAVHKYMMHCWKVDM
ncbi:unnamed protein product [Euphydryas editha]|uniref:Endonuclease/exonuclease/phosphatase domain-containing protein n=1 Tax=Euphydryas editha TaxID=104508 RepID=A0AAU9UV71_EUPED|nr:unnamed protein product [Euphydryas editha]